MASWPAASSSSCSASSSRGSGSGRSTRLLLALCIATAVVSAVTTQGITRLATTADALTASAAFFHGRSVVLQQRLIQDGDLTRLADSPKPIYVYWKERPSLEEGEVRGDFWDLGRVEQGDSRLTGYDFTLLLERTTRGRWPARGEVFVLLGASMMPSVPPRGPTLRAIALAPDNYVDREVRVIGRFKGRNLYGELPLALGKSKWDFVIQSAEGAMWVTGIRPRGKDFDLDPGKRVDTGRWVEVTGVVKREGVTTYIEGSAIRSATAPEESTVEIELPPPPPQPAPEIIFMAPIDADTDVDRATPVRIQFSRDMDPRSVKDHVTVSYVGDPGTPLPPHSVNYLDATHAIEIRFAEPLARFQKVKVELREGIKAIDGQPLKPYTLTFTTGR